MTELEVKLSADISDLRKQLSVAEKELKKLGIVFDESANKGQGAYKKLGKGVANALPATQEFSRVIQDLPFGIQGIGNNIQQLTANFGNLSKQTGGSTAALKAMIGTLSGPAGILLAVSAVTSLMTAFANSNVKLSSVLKFVAGDSDKLAQSQRDLADSYREGISSAQSEISTLEALLSVSRDENRSKEERQRALNKINKEYDSLLPNLSLENVNTEKVTKAVDNLSTSLIRQAKIRGAQNLIAKETEKILELQGNSAIDAANSFDVLSSLIKSGNNAGLAVIDLTTRGLKRQNKEITEAQKRIATFTQSLNDLIGEDIAKKGVFSNVKVDSAKISANIKAETDKVKNDFINLNDIFGINASTQKTLNSFKPDFSNFAVQFNKLGDITGFALKNSVSKIKPQLANIEANFAQFQQNISNVFSSENIAGTISNVFNDVGAAISQGGNLISSFGSSIIGAFGGFLSQFGKQLISYGTAALAFSTVSKGLLNPITAAPSAIAAIAIGSALSIAGGALSSLASGGIGGGGIAGQGSSSSGSNTFSGGGFTSGASGGRVVFEISGQKLIGVLNNTLQGNQRLGGNISIG